MMLLSNLVFKESGLHAVTEADNFVDFSRSAYKKCLKNRKRKEENCY